MRHLLTLTFFLTATAFADNKIIDRTGSWDVDAPLGPSALLEFTTDEGTWMNLDVHPDGSEVVFDLLGEIGDKTLSALYEVCLHERNPLVQFHLQNLFLR